MRGFVEQTRGKYATSKGAHVFFQLYVCVCLCVVYITLILLILVRECVEYLAVLVSPTWWERTVIVEKVL